MAEAIQKQFKAVLIGATGATGRYLFAELLQAKEFSEIVILGRRKATIPTDVVGVNLEEEENSGRLKQHIVVDLDNITNETVGEYFKEKDVLFSCLGTTRAIAGSAERFKHIDHGYNYNFAKVAKENGVHMYSLMSTQGANKNSWFLYLNSKGKLEHDCSLLEFPRYSIFRPGGLDRGEQTKTVEKVAGFFFGLISTKIVARAMCAEAIKQLSSTATDKLEQKPYYNAEIQKFNDEYLKKMEQ